MQGLFRVWEIAAIATIPLGNPATVMAVINGGSRVDVWEDKKTNRHYQFGPRSGCELELPCVWNRNGERLQSRGCGSLIREPRSA